jgi:phage shock protein A
MTLGRRMAMLFKAKASTASDRAEDPRETLDYSYEKQLELLQQVRRGVADVATSRKRLELQAQQLGSSADRLPQQAAQAVAAGREDLAREALTRRSAAQQRAG